MAGLDWVIIGVYFALLLAVAWWVARRNRDTPDDYFLAGRNLGWFDSKPTEPMPVSPCRLIISDAPHCRNRWQIGLACIGGAIHEPDNPLASRAVLPKNIRLAVPVKI